MKEENIIDKTGDVPPSDHEIPMPSVKAPKAEVEKFRLRTVVSDEDIMTLRKESEPVVLVLGDNSGRAFPDKDTSELIQALKDYTVEHNGLGMSAIQLGVARRVFVMRWPYSSDNIVTVINPQFIRGEGRSIKTESCFSIPDLPSNILGARVRRMSTIFINYTDEQGVIYEEEMLVGMTARVFLHELDHLNGFLMLDDKTSTGVFQGWERSF